MKPKILVASKLPESAVAKAKEFAEVDVKTGLTEDELAKIMADYDAIVVRSKPKVTRAMIDAGKKLKVIGRAGVGLDNIDKEAAKERGIQVVNAPESSSVSVAEHAFGLMIALLRHIPHSRESLRAGKWERKTFMGTELSGKTLGLVGFGRIGKEVATRAKAFHMKVIVSDPVVTPGDARNAGVELVSLDELFKKADVISLHVPALDSTRDLANKERIGLMKHSAVILNTSRGHAIDEDALYHALKENRIRGAALDVYKNEPPERHPLLTCDNALCVPHLGANTDEAQINAGLVVIEKIRKAFEGH